MSTRYLIRFESSVTPEILKSVEEPVSSLLCTIMPCQYHNCAHYLILLNLCDISNFLSKILATLHDRMTQCRYLEPLNSFQLDKKPDPWYEVNIMENGRKALEQVNDHLGNATLHQCILSYICAV